MESTEAQWADRVLKARISGRPCITNRAQYERQLSKGWQFDEFLTPISKETERNYMVGDFDRWWCLYVPSDHEERHPDDHALLQYGSHICAAVRTRRADDDFLGGAYRVLCEMPLSDAELDELLVTHYAASWEQHYRFWHQHYRADLANCERVAIYQPGGVFHSSMTGQQFSDTLHGAVERVNGAMGRQPKAVAPEPSHVAPATRAELIMRAVEGYTGRRSRKTGAPWVRPLRRQSGIPDITKQERNEAYALLQSRS